MNVKGVYRKVSGYAEEFEWRGRGDSGDTPPYAVEREIEDLDALIAEAGGSAHVFGASSCGGLALEGAVAGLAIDRLAVYEVPYNMDDDGPHWNQGDVSRVEELLADGRRGDVVELFMRTVGSPKKDIAGAKGSPPYARQRLHLKALRRILSALSPSLSQERNVERMASLCRLRSDW
jgi:hypothetical protein